MAVRFGGAEASVSFKLIGSLLAVGFLTLSCARLNRPSSEPAVAPVVPEPAREAALRIFQGEYGSVAKVYGEGVTTLAEWAAVEPGRNSSRQLTSDNADDPIYALFIEGDFEVIGLAKENGAARANFRAGRIVFDQNGTIISVSLWDEVKPADPPFGPALDDQ